MQQHTQRYYQLHRYKMWLSSVLCFLCSKKKKMSKYKKECFMFLKSIKNTTINVLNSTEICIMYIKNKWNDKFLDFASFHFYPPSKKWGKFGKFDLIITCTWNFKRENWILVNWGFKEMAITLYNSPSKNESKHIFTFIIFFLKAVKPKKNIIYAHVVHSQHYIVWNSNPRLFIYDGKYKGKTVSIENFCFIFGA